jgi:hypothetical protein
MHIFNKLGRVELALSAAHHRVFRLRLARTDGMQKESAKPDRLGMSFAQAHSAFAFLS